MTPYQNTLQQEAEHLFTQMLATGARPVDADLLLPAEVLLDLYGEDIRARAYVTHDPIRGEMMLRPDFTVPVVQSHMTHGAAPARYTYMGKVFRQQYHHKNTEQASLSFHEYLQVGYEVFDGKNPLAADVEVFTLFNRLLLPYELAIAIGDIAVLRAALNDLDTSEKRKAALMRHLWRPKRFHALLKRFSTVQHGSTQREQLMQKLQSGDDIFQGIQQIGLRSPKEVIERLYALKDDIQTPPINAQDVSWLTQVFNVVDQCPGALETLKELAKGKPQLSRAVQNLENRLKLLDDAGVDITTITFETCYGRTTMEYYDGFVFGFYPKNLRHMPAVASGGRYDALTNVLGNGKSIPAVGGIIRPALISQLQQG